MKREFVLFINLYLIFLIIHPFLINADTCNFPFPQQVTYPYGIKPTNYTQAQMNQHCQQWFDQWRAHYVHGQAQDPWMAADEYRVVRYETGDSNKEDTVSEGIGYGMIITVYMSSATNNTKQYFDGMWKFYRRYRNGNGLMNWRIGDGGGVIGSGAATDADEDAAFALMMAHYQWGSSGAINYRQEALTLINAILNNEITGSNDIRPGDGWDFGNISYFAPAYYRMFGDFSGNTRWYSVASRTYNTIINYYRNHPDTYNPTTGLYTWLMPNWCNYDGTRNDSNDSWAMDSYSYWWDACRTPWRLAYDYLLYGTLNHQYAYDCPATMSRFFRTRYSGNPGNIKSHYALNGNEKTYCRNDRTPDLCDEDVMCLPPVEGAIACAAMVEGNQTWLNAAYERLVQFPFPTDTGVNWGTDYFADILKMLYLLVLTGNMKNPLGDYPTPTHTFTWDVRTPTYTPTPTVAANVFDDFETGTLVNLDLPSSQGGFTAVVNSTANPRYGARSCQITSRANYGWAGFGIDTPYGGSNGYRDFRGATTIEFDVYSTANFTGFIKVIEAVNPGDSQGQDWSNRNNQFTVQSGAWRHISINLSTLTIDSYSPSGDSTFDLAYIKKFFLQIDNPPNATIYIDHIIFGGTIVTYTPTITVTRTRTPAGSPTNTPTITRTHTNTPYLSPTASPTNTIYLTFTITRTFTISPTFSVTPVFTPIRVNCAGPQYTGGGLTWAADKVYTAGSWGYVGGSTADRGSIAIANTTDDPLYQTERYGNPTYRFDIPNGTYEVTLKFAETYWTSAGARIFDVLIEGITVLDNLDIYAQVGSNYAYDRTFVVTVSDGQLTITMTSTADTGEINAIQVLRFEPTPTRTPSWTRTYTYTQTFTRTPSPTRTATQTYTLTITRTNTPATNTYTGTATGTITPTYTRTATWTRTVTGTTTRTNTQVITNTWTITPTQTATMTQTAISTSTWTRTITPTHTRTISPTYSVSPTITQTWTGTPPSQTNTPTRTQSWTESPTRTRTQTLTYTITSTRTNTPIATNTWTATSTYTVSLTNTRTITPTYTQTATGTLTRTNTITGTPTYTASLTRTLTNTPTYTLTISPTHSVSPTITQTWTGTPPTSTITPTNTLTGTISNTYTYTSTQTSTPTWTFTVSNTNTQTRTQTPTWTVTHTRTATWTQTISSTYSVSPTITRTWTGTVLSQTNTPTNTLSFTSTTTRTSTPTLTYTFTSTFTRTLTLTPTASMTNTFTPELPTYTPTFTETTTDNRQSKIDNVVIYPNPYNLKENLNIGFNLSQNCKTIKVKIWTSGFRLIKTINYLGYDAGGQILAVESKNLTNLANGVYYIVLEAINYEDKKVISKPQVLVVIK